MKSLKTVDIFKNNPFRAFKNAGFHMNTHLCWESKQPYDCFYYVIKGRLRLTMAGKDHYLGPDDVLLLRSTDHAWLYSESNEGISYYFVSFYCDENIDMNIKTVCHRTGTESLFQEILMARRSADALSRLQLAQLFLKLIWTLASLAEETQQVKNRNYRFRAAVEYVNLKYDEQITIQHLCRIANYSPAHLRRLFVRTFGVSPQAYIMQKRIEAAKEQLLEHTGNGIEAIALSLGFSSASYFCKQFKQHVGMTPMAYQKKRKI